MCECVIEMVGELLWGKCVCTCVYSSPNTQHPTHPPKQTVPTCTRTSKGARTELKLCWNVRVTAETCAGCASCTVQSVVPGRFLEDQYELLCCVVLCWGWDG